VTVQSAGFRLPATFAVAILAATSVLQPASIGGTSGSVELHIKAAYLFNFGRYVSWPQQTGDVVIGVLGHDSIVEILERTIAGKTINGRAYRVKVFASPEQIDHCDIVFVPRSEAKYTQPVLTAVSGKPVLTVSDQENFSSDGGMIEFLLIDDTLKFDINLAAAEKSGLKISSELLRVAHEIKGRRR
jgi:YfiR/HmsC-like